MRKIKLDKYYFIQELTPEKTLKILKLMKSIDVEKIDDLDKGIKTVKKIVKIALGRRFKATNSQLVLAFKEIVEELPLSEYYQITLIARELNKTRQQ